MSHKFHTGKACGRFVNRWYSHDDYFRGVSVVDTTTATRFGSGVGRGERRKMEGRAPFRPRHLDDTAVVPLILCRPVYGLLF